MVLAVALAVWDSERGGQRIAYMLGLVRGIGCADRLHRLRGAAIGCAEGVIGRAGPAIGNRPSCSTPCSAPKGAALGVCSGVGPRQCR